MDIFIDNRFFRVNSNYTIFQYCAKIGINLPCFCYHERLSIAGNCRICLVEANSALVVSCATSLIDNMQIYTKTKRINKARESVLEFLLVNHPLDCPICDQGGECDLQDILIVYGSDRGRFYEINKRSVNNLNCCGPFIKTIMTRCIHCTRCVRFVNEISSVFDLGIIGRGSNMEIGTYIPNFIDDELSGNIIDLCPVGALTHMPSAFSGRTWEYKYIQSVDILDSIGSTIKIAIISNSVARIVPSLNEVYDEWISNKARFIYDSFSINRLYYPKLRLNSKFITISWKIALILFLYLLYNRCNNNIKILCGPYLSLELSLILKNFFNSIGCSNLYCYENNIINYDFRFSYLLNVSIKLLNKISTLILCGTNPRLESPLLNSYLRKNYLNNFNFKIFSIGLSINYLTYPVINLGSSLKYLFKYLTGNTTVSKYILFNNYYNNYFFNYDNYIDLHILVGTSYIIRKDSESILDSILHFFFEFNLKIQNFNILSKNLGRLSGLEIGIFPKIINKEKNFKIFNFFIGIDDKNLFLEKNNNLNIFQGFFYIYNLLKYMNILLPTSIYSEKYSSYINLEGRYRYTNKAIIPFKYVFLDTSIIEGFFILWKNIYLYNFSIIKNFYFIIKYFIFLYDHFIYTSIGIKQGIYFFRNYNKYNKNYIYLFNNNFNKKLNNSLISKVIYNFYNNDIFSKQSKILCIIAKKVKILTFYNSVE